MHFEFAQSTYFLDVFKTVVYYEMNLFFGQKSAVLTSFSQKFQTAKSGKYGCCYVTFVYLVQLK